MMDPAPVGTLVLDAVRNDEFYVITHGEWKSLAEARHAALIAAMPTVMDPALAAMLAARRPHPDRG